MHFLRVSERPPHSITGRVTGKPWACVTVRVESKGERLVVQPGSIAVTKRDTLFWPLPERCSVVDEEGTVVKPSAGRRFFVSLETFDPHHLLIEIEPVEVF